MDGVIEMLACFSPFCYGVVGVDIFVLASWAYVGDVWHSVEFRFARVLVLDVYLEGG